MLYLDKAWRQLHELFDRVCPAASPLVDGDVTHCSFGWIPHLGVLDPSEVVLIAAALSTVSESDVLTEPLPAHIGDGLLRDISEELDYVVQYLEEAKKFTAALAEDSLGLVYMIG